MSVEMAGTAFVVMYTNQKTKKAKTWHDGFLRVCAQGTKATLHDEKGIKLDAIYVKHDDIVVGEQLESDRFLILVDDKKSADVATSLPCVTAGQENKVVSQPVPVNPISQVPRSRGPGLKRKRTGFVPPRMIKQPKSEPDIDVVHRQVYPTSQTNNTFQPKNTFPDTVLNLYNRDRNTELHTNCMLPGMNRTVNPGPTNENNENNQFSRYISQLRGSQDSQGYSSSSDNDHQGSQRKPRSPWSVYGTGLTTKMTEKKRIKEDNKLICTGQPLNSSSFDKEVRSGMLGSDDVTFQSQLQESRNTTHADESLTRHQANETGSKAESNVAPVPQKRSAAEIMALLRGKTSRHGNDCLSASVNTCSDKLTNQTTTQNSDSSMNVPYPKSDFVQTAMKENVKQVYNSFQNVCLDDTDKNSNTPDFNVSKSYTTSCKLPPTLTSNRACSGNVIKISSQVEPSTQLQENVDDLQMENCKDSEKEEKHLVNTNNNIDTESHLLKGNTKLFNQRTYVSQKSDSCFTPETDEVALKSFSNEPKDIRRNLMDFKRENLDVDESVYNSERSSVDDTVSVGVHTQMLEDTKEDVNIIETDSVVDDSNDETIGNFTISFSPLSHVTDSSEDDDLDMSGTCSVMETVSESVITNTPEFNKGDATTERSTNIISIGCLKSTESVEHSRSAVDEEKFKYKSEDTDSITDNGIPFDMNANSLDNRTNNRPSGTESTSNLTEVVTLEDYTNGEICDTKYEEDLACVGSEKCEAKLVHDDVVYSQTKDDEKKYSEVSNKSDELWSQDSIFEQDLNFLSDNETRCSQQNSSSSQTGKEHDQQAVRFNKAGVVTKGCSVDVCTPQTEAVQHTVDHVKDPQPEFVSVSISVDTQGDSEETCKTFPSQDTMDMSSQSTFGELSPDFRSGPSTYMNRPWSNPDVNKQANYHRVFGQSSFTEVNMQIPSPRNVENGNSWTGRVDTQYKSTGIFQPEFYGPLDDVTSDEAEVNADYEIFKQSGPVQRVSHHRPSVVGVDITTTQPPYNRLTGQQQCEDQHGQAQVPLMSTLPHPSELFGRAIKQKIKQKHSEEDGVPCLPETNEDMPCSDIAGSANKLLSQFRLRGTISSGAARKTTLWTPRTVTLDDQAYSPVHGLDDRVDPVQACLPGYERSPSLFVDWNEGKPCFTDRSTVTAWTPSIQRQVPEILQSVNTGTYSPVSQVVPQFTVGDSDDELYNNLYPPRMMVSNNDHSPFEQAHSSQAYRAYKELPTMSAENSQDEVISDTCTSRSYLSKFRPLKNAENLKKHHLQTRYPLSSSVNTTSLRQDCSGESRLMYNQSKGSSCQVPLTPEIPSMLDSSPYLKETYEDSSPHLGPFHNEGTNEVIETTGSSSLKFCEERYCPEAYIDSDIDDQILMDSTNDVDLPVEGSENPDKAVILSSRWEKYKPEEEESDDMDFTCVTQNKKKTAQNFVKESCGKLDNVQGTTFQNSSRDSLIQSENTCMTRKDMFQISSSQCVLNDSFSEDFFSTHTDTGKTTFESRLLNEKSVETSPPVLVDKCVKLRNTLTGTPSYTVQPLVRNTLTPSHTVSPLVRNTLSPSYNIQPLERDHSPVPMSLRTKSNQDALLSQRSHPLAVNPHAQKRSPAVGQRLTNTRFRSPVLNATAAAAPSNRGPQHQFCTPMMNTVHSQNVLLGSQRSVSGDLMFPSKAELDCNPQLTRQVTIPLTFPSVPVYKQVLVSALKECLNLRLFDLAKKYHSALSRADTTEYTPVNRGSMKHSKPDLKSADNQNPACNCSVPSKMIAVKKSGNNQGRFFYACSAARNQQCKFFQWADQSSRSGGTGSSPANSILKLSDPANITTYFRSQHIIFYCECSFFRKSRECITAFFKGPSKWGKKHDQLDSLQKKQIFLRLPRKDASSFFSKDDVWIVSQHLNFDPSSTFIARSTYHGPSSNNELEIEPLTGFSPSNWHNEVSCHAILAVNATTELGCIQNIENHLQPQSLPVLSYLLNRTVDKSVQLTGSRFRTPSVTGTPGSKENIFVPASCVDEVAQSFVARYKLNMDQAEAVWRLSKMFSHEKSAAVDPILLIHGVFGAGKSYLLSVMVLFLMEIFKLNEQFYSEEPFVWRLLISSTTNVAVDRILSGLLDLGFEDFIRVGSVKKIAKPVLPYSVHATGTDSQELKDLQEMLRSGELTPSEKHNVRQSIEKHRAGENKKKLGRVCVVGATCASCMFSCLSSMKFPLVMLDECSQMTEPTSLLPVAKFECQKLIIVGDPKQLDPTIQGSEPAHRDGLEQTLFDRLDKMGYLPTILRTQYRCHPRISAISNQLFYGGMLIDGVTDTNRQPLVPELPTLCFYDVSRGQENSERGGSYYNEKEAQFVAFLIQVLLCYDIDPSAIGVITLYKAQMNRIIDILQGTRTSGQKELRGIQVSTVDAFQGGERDIIILSCVRTQFVGFIDSDKRTNVALTRARHHMFIVGHLRNLTSNLLWGQVISHCTAAPDGVQDADDVTVRLETVLTSAQEKHTSDLAVETDKETAKPPTKRKRTKGKKKKKMVGTEDSPPLSLTDVESQSSATSLPFELSASSDVDVRPGSAVDDHECIDNDEPVPSSNIITDSVSRGNKSRNRTRLCDRLDPSLFDSDNENNDNDLPAFEL